METSERKHGMKTLVALALAATITSAQAQSLLEPPRFDDSVKTLPWTDANGVNNGAATFSGNRIYLRDHSGEHVATIVYGRNGVTFHDPDGRTIPRRDIPRQEAPR
jgi:hypothetical protein